MSSFPSNRTQAPSPGRPSPAGGPAAATTLDPVKLMKKYAWAMPIVLIVGLGLGLGLWVTLRVFFPRYTAEVTFAVQNQVDVDQIGEAPNIDDDEIERFMSTQRDRMTSESNLRNVAADSRLSEQAPGFYKQFQEGGVINPSEATEELQKAVRASIIQGTYLIRLKASNHDDVTAAGLATLVQANYLSSLKAETTRELTATRTSLNNRVSELNTKLANLSARRARLIRDENIDTLDTDRNDASQKLELVNVALIEVQQEIESTKVTLESYETMLTSDTGIQYTDTQIASIEFDPAVQNFQAQLNDLNTSRKALLRQGLTPEHRTIKGLDNQIAATEQELGNVREQKLRKMFDAELDGLRQSTNQLRAQEADLLRQSEELNAIRIDLARTIGEIEELDREIKATEDERADQQRDLGELAKKDPTAIMRIATYENARVPDKVSFPRWQMVIPATLFLFFAVIAGIVVALELLDQRVRSAADIALIPRTRVVGVLPDIDEDLSEATVAEDVFKTAPKSVLAEHYRQLRSSVLKSMDRAGHRTLMVAGCQPGSGASSVAMNMALACAAARRKTLLIDANYRRPSLHTLTGNTEDNGLAEILSGRGTFDPESTRHLDESLDLLPVGQKELRVYEHLGSETMSALLAKATETYDIVILDVSPALISSDAATLANRVDASILVVRALAEKRGMVARLKRDLDDARGEFLGVVVNAVRSAAGGYMRKNIQTAHDYQTDPADSAEPSAGPERKSA
ncbi:MAG: succinoglycan biosynthesis transport protein ExoP [Phycisphaerales bacterium]|jgi:succinoglycan biosynthesis transport protein ExoP